MTNATQRAADTAAAQNSDHLSNPLHALHRIERKVDELMASEEDVLASIAGLKTDLEGVAANAQAEFTKLEQEVKEAQEAGGKPINLDGIKTAIDTLDQGVKGIVVPTT